MKTDTPYMLIEAIYHEENGSGLADVKLNGNSRDLVNIIATAMQGHSNVRMILAYANDEYLHRIGEVIKSKDKRKKKEKVVQLELF